MKAKDLVIKVITFLGLVVLANVVQKIIFQLYEAYQHIIRGNEFYEMNLFDCIMIQNTLITALIIFVGYLILKKNK